MEWWIWVLAGLVLLGIEVFIPGGFFLAFFGLAALLVGGATAAGIAGQLTAQVLLFIALSIAGILLFRRALVSRFGQGRHGAEVDGLVGTTAEALEDLPVGAAGKVELRGTTWTARNSGGLAIAQGQQCTVERLDGLTLWVRIAAEEFLGDTRGTQEPRASGEPARLSPGAAAE